MREETWQELFADGSRSVLIERTKWPCRAPGRANGHTDKRGATLAPRLLLRPDAQDAQDAQASAAEEIVVASAMSSFTPGPIVDETVMALT